MPQQESCSNKSPLSTINILLSSLVFIIAAGGAVYFNAQHSSSSKITVQDQSLISKSQTQTEQVAENTVPNLNSELSPLVLNQQLRWDFDDLILTYQETGQAITSLLFSLSERLNLTLDAHHYLIDLFNRYRDYKIALVEVKKMAPNMLNGLDIEDTLASIERAYQSQFDYFTPIKIDIEDTLAFIDRAHQSQFDYFTQIEIDAFFSDENSYDIQAIERMTILQDSWLSSEQKQMLIAHQISQMNAEEREVYEPSLQVFNIVDNLEGKNSQLNDFTPEVTMRIEQLQQDEKIWKTKVIDFLAFQIKNKKPDESDTQELINNYQNKNFSDNQLKRLQVYIDNPKLLNTD